MQPVSFRRRNIVERYQYDEILVNLRIDTLERIICYNSRVFPIECYFVFWSTDNVGHDLYLCRFTIHLLSFNVLDFLLYFIF